MAEIIIALDAGGTAVKAAAYDRRGKELALCGETMTPIRPAAGYQERNADEMWAALCRCVRRVMGEAGADGGDVAAIGLTGFGNGLFLVDGDGRPVRNAILSSDQRAAGIVAEWRAAGIAPRHVDLALQQLWAGKPLPLLAWLERHEPGSVDRARHVLMCKDFMRFKLTGRFGLEVSDASSGSLTDRSTRSWNNGVLDLLGLRHLERLFNDVLEPLTIGGVVTEQAAAATGLRAGTPVSAGYADGPSMALAMGVIDASRLTVIAGTWGLNQLTIKTPVADGSILACMQGPRPGEFVLVEGGATSASTFEWFTGTIAAGALPSGQATASALYDWCNISLAKLSDDDLPVYFLPWLNGRTDKSEARGGFVGLSSWHGLPHMARAVFEGVALEHRRHIDLLLASQQERPQAARFAGGAARSRQWMDIFAAALDMPLEVSEAKELGALGASIVAAVGAGVYPDLESAVAGMTRVGATITPDPHKVEILARRNEAYAALRRQLEPLWGSI